MSKTRSQNSKAHIHTLKSQQNQLKIVRDESIWLPATLYKLMWLDESNTELKPRVHTLKI